MTTYYSGLTIDNYTCPNCGKPYWEQRPSTGGTCKCTFTSPAVESVKSKQYGWVCPVCGKGKSPWSTECSH